MQPRRMLLSLLAGLLGLVLAEVSFRVFAPRLGDVDRSRLTDLRAFVRTGRSPLYEPRAHTVFVRNREREDTNSLGFRGAEWEREKTPGVPRVALLGGSTTESIDPVFLAGAIERRAGRPFEVLNAGMSGWTTAESLVNWFLIVQDYAPDVVVLHHAINDVPPRFRRGHRPDYSHYRRPWAPPDVNALECQLVRWSDLYAWIVLERGLPTTVQELTTWPVTDSTELPGSPLPYAEGVETYRRNLVTIGRHARSLGAAVVLMTMPSRPDDLRDYDTLMRRGLDEHNAVLRELAATEGWTLFDLATAFAEVEGSAEWFTDLVHLTDPGRERKAEMLAEVLAGDRRAD